MLLCRLYIISYSEVNKLVNWTDEDQINSILNSILFV